MTRRPWLVVGLAQAGLLAGFAALVRSGVMPLGVRGEWEWSRIRMGLDPLAMAIALAVLAAYAGFAAIGLRSLAGGGRGRGWLLGLVPLAIGLQMALQEAAPEGYGLAKWALALHDRGASGYYTVAKTRMPDLPRFLADYPRWVAGQDALHVGTHPPGLFVTSWAVLRLMEAHPGWARAVVSALPGSSGPAFQALGAISPLPAPDRASMGLTGFAILVACSATAVPLYALARSTLPRPGAWAAAVLWPLVPAAILFQPTADAAFPLISTSALALAAGASRRPRLAVVAGAVLGVGTQFTLAFFPVGLVVAIFYATDRSATPRRRLLVIALTGVGFLAVTLATWAATGGNPFATWRANAANHARFYVEFPRTYRAWVVANPIELVAGIGVPTAVLASIGLRRGGPRVAWGTLAVLAGLTLSGKNLSEVARLWLPLMPPLLAAAGAGVERLGPRPAGLAVAIGLIGTQVLWLQATIQVVYPV